MATFDPEVLRLLEIIRNASSSSSSGSGGGGGGATTGMPATQQQTASSQQQAQSIPPPTSSPSITTTQDPRLNRAPKASIPPPQSYTHPHTHAHPPQPQAPAQAHSYTQFQPQQQQQQQQQTSKLDPRTITTYPSALRYITTTLLPQNPNLLPRLRRLRINQHNNERQWHRSRQELVQKHKRRKLNTKNVEDILFNLTNAIGGGAKGGSNNNNNTPPTTTTGAEEREMEELRRKEEEELRAFDGKVWKAARVMESQVARELEGWGVPGFVVGGGGAGKSEKEGGTGAVVVDPAVQKLRGQVMDLLGDLVGEDEEGGAGGGGGDAPMGGMGGLSENARVL